jgi:bzd-type benzoyl-CoA reductase N subunit
MEKIDALKNILADPYAYGREFKNLHAKKIVGYTCSYGPEELIHAAGALPFRIFGTHETIQLADRHLQSYCCSIVRGILEEALSGRLDFLDGVVFPHTCDSFQRLSDIWRLNVADCFHIDFVLPVKLNTGSARSYMIEILEQFKADLENRLGVTISEEMLRDAIQTFNQIRAAMMRIYEARSRLPGVIKGRDLNAIVQAAMIAERSFMRDALTRIADRLEKAKPDPAGENARRLILTGSVCSQPDIYDAIESAGGAVVWDDLCTGARYFDGRIDTSLPVFEALAQRYLDRAVCPAKHAGLAQRGSALLQAVERHRADGVVFLFLKFCDPHAFDYPYIKEMLDKARIPSLLLEIEDQRFSQGQMQTRLETFIEII